MYLNFFKRQWCVEQFKDLYETIAKQYSIYALTLQHDKIQFPTFRERYITHIIVESGNNRMSFEVNGKIGAYDFIRFCGEYDKFNALYSKTNDTHLQQEMKTEVESTLGIDNNVDWEKDKKITFCLNDYTSVEREKMLAFLANIDGNSPEVYISIDLSSCSKEQAEHLSNILVCATSLTNG